MSEPNPATDEASTATAVARACAESHLRLMAGLESVDEVVVRRQSRLPEWTVGHVLTHLARNADSFVRMLEAAAEGAVVAQYPGGAPQRTGDIETGSERSAAAITNDLRSAIERLDTAFAEAANRDWAGECRVSFDVLVPCSSLPARRWREVELHHVDLGLGYEISDWPGDFVSSELADSLRRLPRRIADEGERAALLAWVAGRIDDLPKIDLAPF